MKHQNMAGVVITAFFMFLLLQSSAVGARNLDDDFRIPLGNSGVDQYARWANGILLRWPGEPDVPITLKYGFEQNMKHGDLEAVGIDYLSEKEMKNAFSRAFAKWSSAIQVDFEEIDYVDGSEPDIKIGFFYFDGWMNGDLIHASFPPSGGLRLSAHVTWSVGDPKKDAFDLESVAIHAIGHVLGLDHSHSEEGIMYKQMSPGIKKLDLASEDVARAQQLYGPNPQYHQLPFPNYHSFPVDLEHHHLAPAPAPSQLLPSSSMNLGTINILLLLASLTILYVL